jgi:hypothetical protein
LEADQRDIFLVLWSDEMRFDMPSRRHRRVRSLLALLVAGSAGAGAHAAPVSYGGRLVDIAGAPLSGPLTLEVRLYAAGDASSPVWTTLVEGVELTSGVFQLTLEPPLSVIGSSSAPAWIELHDVASGVTYPRQRWASVPYAAVAASVPVDGATLGFDASGQLTVLSAPGVGNVPNPLPAVDGGALTNVNASALRGAPVASASASVGQVLKWDGSAWAPAADTDTTNPGTVTSIVAGSGLTGGTITGSGTLAVDAGTGVNQIVRLDAAAKLPAVDGSALTDVNAVTLQNVDVDSTAPSVSQVLKYDGSKWAPATDANSGGTVTSVTAGTGLTGGTITGSGTIALATPMPALDGGALTNVNAVKLQGRTISGTPPSDGHVLKWNAGASTWDAAPDDGGVAGAISSGQNRGTSDATTADVYESTSAPNIRFRRLKEGTGVDLTQNADDITIAVAANGISAAELAVDAVGSDEIAEGAVTASEIATDAVGSAEIAADAVTASEIAADAVGSAEIAAGGVGNAELAADSVTSAKIQDGQVQTADLAADAVTTSEILNGTITGADVSQSAALSVASVGVSAQAGVTLSPFGVAAGNTGEARFKELAAGGGNFVALKAPDALAADVTYILPAAPASDGQVLSGTTAGSLSWTALPTALPPSGAAGGDLTGSYPNPTLAASSVSSAAIMDATIGDADVSGTAAIATSKLSGAVTQIAGHGLGSLAGASTVTSAEITDGTIADADVSGTAQIATSKLSGAITQVAGHGLGALATMSTVGSSEIANGAIADADVSGTAAIATSKLSGAVTSISGHGLGSLATASTVTTSEITDGTILNADVSGTAAIATSKLSGALTAVSGHGLGSLATLSSVTSATITDGSIVDADISGTAAISSTKISFANDSISGDKIDSGTISNFASTGIDDNAATIAMTINSSGNVGIGTTSPGSMLDVAGGVRAGSSTAVTSCGMGQANGEGTQRYNYTNHTLEYCNGTAWIQPAGASNFSNITTQTFTSSGTFTVPSGVRLLKVLVVGGGGAGSYAANQGVSGGGGGRRPGGISSHSNIPRYCL